MTLRQMQMDFSVHDVLCNKYKVFMLIRIYHAVSEMRNACSRMAEVTLN